MRDKREAQVQAGRPAGGGPDATGLVVRKDGVLVQQRRREQPTELGRERVAGRAANTVEKACRHHSLLVENLFRLMAEQARRLSRRVEVLSQRSIRDKLLCYFRILGLESGAETFTLPFSLSTLADYISTDRSAMMRELKKMRQDGVVAIDGRRVSLLGQEDRKLGKRQGIPDNFGN